ncbi:hypothetical protein K445DRAFT_138705 [Daldinia sp. EC12]|nr:hypothetical protein K445DRAFT_138705 [Daldinia sp. EC12]
MASDSEDLDSLSDESFEFSDLEKALILISDKGGFAAFSPTKRVDPEIFVQDVGKIAVPLSETQAKQLAAKSHRASYKEDNKTIVNTSVRNAWELNPDQFKIRAPGWQAYLNKSLSFLASRLNITSPISAKLHKMLLYEEGAMFKAHTGAERIPGMFGTLAISLPSPHQGGDVVVKYRNTSMKFRTSKHNMTCAVWFSDASHEVLPVKSGYRWVLTYNLTIEPTAVVPTAAASLENEPLRTALQEWSEEISDGGDTSPLFYILDHKYTKGNFSFQTLKGADHNRALHLQNMCAELNFDLFLATLEKKETGPAMGLVYNAEWLRRYSIYDDESEDDDGEPRDLDNPLSRYHRLEEVQDRSYQAKHVFDLNGKQLASNLPVDEDLILEGPSFNEKPDIEQCHHDKIDDWGPDATHWFRASTVVIIPCAETASFLTSVLFKGVPNISALNKLCDYFINQCITSPEKALRLSQLYKFLTMIFESPHYKSPLTECQLLKVLQLSIHGTKPDLFDLVKKKNTLPLPIEFFTWIRGAYDKSVISVDNFEKLFLYALGLQPAIQGQWLALQKVNEDLEEHDERLQGIMSRAVDECLEACRHKGLQEEDGKALFSISYYQRGVKYLKTTVVPVVEDLGHSTAFVLGFLHSFHLQTSKDGTQVVYKRVAFAALKKLELALLAAREMPQDEKKVNNTDSENTQDFEYVTYEVLLGFVSTLIKLKLQNHLDILAQKVIAQANNIKAQKFDTLWIPLLNGLFEVFEENRVHLSAPCWTQIYQSLFKAYLLNHVQERPKESTLSRKALKPCCEDCRLVSKFLIDPNMRSSSITLVEKRQQHIIRRLKRGGAHIKSFVQCISKQGTLVVTKIPTRDDEAMNRWRARRLHAESLFKTFNPDMLRAVLQDQYDDIINLKLIERQSVTSNTHAVATGSHEDQTDLANTEISRKKNPSSITPNPRTGPRPPAPSSTAVSAGPARPTPQPTPKGSTLDVNESISERLRKRKAQDPLSSLAKRGPSVPSPASGRDGGSTPSRRTQTIPNPIAGAKRKFTKVTDPTDDD